MKSRAWMIAFCFAALLLPSVNAAEELILEAPPRTNIAAEADLCDLFYVCSMWHELYPVYCTDWHVIYCGPVYETRPTDEEGTQKMPARVVTFENAEESKTAEITRAVPQLHLSTGAIVEPQGDWSRKDANGATWVEVRPIAKRQYQVANWEDSSHDGEVGKGDRVIFADGTEAEILAERLGVHLNVLETKPRK